MSEHYLFSSNLKLAGQLSTNLTKKISLECHCIFQALLENCSYSDKLYCKYTPLGKVILDADG